MDQHFCSHPESLFSRNIEGTVADPNNELVLRGHLNCAASEQKLSDDDVLHYFGPTGKEVVASCIKDAPRTLTYVKVDEEVPPELEGSAAARKKVDLLKYVGLAKAKKGVDLRGIDPIQYKVKVRDTQDVLETVDQRSAVLQFYPGAVCLHRNRTYQVADFNEKDLVIWVVPRDAKKLDYYTEVRDHTRIDLLGLKGRERVNLLAPIDQPSVAASSSAAASAAASSSSAVVEQKINDHGLLGDGEITVNHGPCKVSLSVYGFRKKSKKDKKLIDLVEYELAPVEYSSSAVWCEIPEEIMHYVYEEPVHSGALHTIEHLLLSMCPLAVSMNQSDFSCQHTRNEADPCRAKLLLFETQRGGLGLVGEIAKNWSRLLHQALMLLEECPCEKGCPSCIFHSLCGSYNIGLDKAGAQFILRKLLRKADVDKTGIPNPVKRQKLVSAQARAGPPTVPEGSPQSTSSASVGGGGIKKMFGDRLKGAKREHVVLSDSSDDE